MICTILAISKVSLIYILLPVSQFLPFFTYSNCVGIRLCLMICKIMALLVHTSHFLRNCVSCTSATSLNELDSTFLTQLSFLTPSTFYIFQLNELIFLFLSLNVSVGKSKFEDKIFCCTCGIESP
jgi:hypothetical protein